MTASQCSIQNSPTGILLERTPIKGCHKNAGRNNAKEGIKLFLSFPARLVPGKYFPRGNTGQTAGRPDKGDWYKYLDFMDGQLTELLTNYGKIGGIGLTVTGIKRFRLGLDKTYGLIHSPNACLIGTNPIGSFPGRIFRCLKKTFPDRKRPDSIRNNRGTAPPRNL